jgi:hypothetical protein
MLTRTEYLAVQELHRQGSSISAIARRLGRDRKTVRSYLGGGRVAGVRSRVPDASLRFLPYCRQRLTDDPHLLATQLFAEVVELGYPGGYSTFTRALRSHQLRPPCTRCRPATCPGGPAQSPPHSGQEIRFDWLQLTAPPLRWGCGERAQLLVATLASSGRWRGALTDGDDLPHLVEAIDRLLRGFGGTPGGWRLDRAPTVCSAASGRMTSAFAQVARYYGVAVRLGAAAPPDPGSAQRDAALRAWWHGTAHDTGLTGAQDELERLAAAQDAPPAGRQPALSALPVTPFPVRLCVRRIVDPQGLVAYRDSFYAVQPELVGALVEVRRRLDEPYLSITTLKGAVIARHRLAPPGSARTVADAADAIALERPARLPRAQGHTCQDSRGHRPPSWQALAEADALRGHPAPGAPDSGDANPAADATG